MEKKGTLKQKRRLKGDQNPQKGPLGDLGLRTQLGTVRQKQEKVSPYLDLKMYKPPTSKTRLPETHGQYLQVVIPVIFFW